MDNKNSLKSIYYIIVAYLVIIFGTFLLTIKYIESPVMAAIVGTIIGSIGGVFGFIISAWSKARELREKTEDREEQIRDRSSKYALELTKMDFELRQKSLQSIKSKAMFLAPTKVYRELYKALLELHKKGTWPKTIEQLGLLNIFPLGPDNDKESKN